MPRTFSRGKQVTSDFLNDMQQYLSIDEGDLWVRLMRKLYCPEEALIEQDLQPFFENFLPQNLNQLDNLIDGITGSGIIPGSMRTVVAELRGENITLLSGILDLTTPILPV